MKKITIITLFLLVFSSLFYGQEKVRKTFDLDGKKITKWFYAFEDYDYSSNLEWQNNRTQKIEKKDKAGNIIYEKTGESEHFYEYTAKKQLKYRKDVYAKQVEFEEWNEYDGDLLIHKKTKSAYLDKPHEIWYDYDEKNNLIYESDSEDNETWYKYDKKNRVLMIKKSNGEGTVYTYDKSGLVSYTTKINEDRWGIGPIYSTYNAKDQLIEYETPNYTDEYEYDDAGNCIHYVKTNGSKILEERWTEYDSNKNVTLEKDSSGNVYTYRYDKKGNLYYVSYSEDFYVFYEYQFDSKGNPKSRIAYSSRNDAYGPVYIQ